VNINTERKDSANVEIKAVFNPVWTFIKMYILKRGFLDGWEGYIIARLYAQYTFWKYIKNEKRGKLGFRE